VAVAIAFISGFRFMPVRRAVSLKNVRAFSVGSLTINRRENRWLTTARSWHGPASVRRPSRLLQRQRRGVTPVAVRQALQAPSRRQTPRRFGFGTWALAVQLRR
jgi:hypothetical protein